MESLLRFAPLALVGGIVAMVVLSGGEPAAPATSIGFHSPHTAAQVKAILAACEIRPHHLTRSSAGLEWSASFDLTRANVGCLSGMAGVAYIHTLG